MDSDFTEVYQFRISLKGIEPAIWRRIQVPADYTFWDLHVAIQDVMGWLDYHLHVFRVVTPGRPDGLVQTGIPDEEFSEGTLPGWDVALSNYFSERNNSAEYEYDFGDGWIHALILEKLLPRKKGSKYPRCLAGERRCPPEDCGGIGGYQSFLEAILDPSHDEHKGMLEWVGGPFDPEGFEPHEVRFDDPDKRWQIAVIPVK